MNTEHFAYAFRCAGMADIGKRRSSNQDRVILAPELGFFGVSDGMGGLAYGEIAAEYVAEAMPIMVKAAADELKSSPDADAASAKLKAAVSTVSDCLYENQNSDGHIRCGATLASVWLIGDQAVFSWLGDSRGYVLPRYKKNLRQITKDMNVAALLVENGDLTKEEAKDHPTSSQLTAFVGMPAPAETATAVTELSRGDRILLCSDGLYGMVSERDIVRIMRSSRSPETVCRRLVDAANAAGGRDNISAVYILIK